MRHGARKKAGRHSLFSVGLSAALMLLVLSFFSPLSSRLVSSWNFSEGSAAARLALWREAIQIFTEHPVLGAGLGNYAVAVNPYASYRTPTNAHSTYLESAAELGAVGLVFFVFALGSAIVLAYRFARRGSVVHRACLFGLLFFAVHAVFETNLYHPANLVVFLTLLTIAGLSPKETSTQRISNPLRMNEYS